MSNKHKASGVWVDEHGMVVGQLVGQHPQGHYQPPQPMHSQRSGALIVDEAPPPHYHGQKVLLDHNDNELGAGGHYHHRMGSGALVNGSAGKDPNWKPQRRRRKDDESAAAAAAAGGLVSGVQRLYLNANPHLIHATGAYHHQAQPAQPVHHHNSHHSHPAQHHHHHHHQNHQPYQSNSNNPHAKVSPTSPGQVVPSNGAVGAAVVARTSAGGGGASSGAALTAVGSSNSAALLAGEQTPILVPVLQQQQPQVVEVPRSRRDPHHSHGHHHHHSSNGGSSSSSTNVSVAGTGGASSTAAAGGHRPPPAQFDLAASAFPPLPGSSSPAEIAAPVAAATVSGAAAAVPPNSAKNVSQASSGVAGKAAEARKPMAVPIVPDKETGSVSSAGEGPQTNEENQSGEHSFVGSAATVAPAASAWGDSLADVVKGTAKVAKLKADSPTSSSSPTQPLSTPSSTNANGECWEEDHLVRTPC